MTKRKLCPNCLGEGEIREGQYGSMRNGAWLTPSYLEARHLAHFRVISPCKPCSGTGWLKVLDY